MESHLLSAGPPNWGTWSDVKSPYSSGKMSIALITLLSVNCCTKVWELARLHLCLSYLSHCGFFLFILYCGKSFLLVFSSFSKVITLFKLCCA